MYDDYGSLEAAGRVPYDPVKEARVVAVSGRSVFQAKARDDFRLKGWVGATEAAFGREWDKGHFIAHSIGGAVDRAEVNVLVQLRALNRGWSTEGKLFREMEAYCEANPGTFCFNRPIYEDQTGRPVFIEFGLLKPMRAVPTSRLLCSVKIVAASIARGDSKHVSATSCSS